MGKSQLLVEVQTPEHSSNKESATTNKRKLFSNLIQVIVSGGLIYWLLRGTNLTEIFTAVRSANIWLCDFR